MGITMEKQRAILESVIKEEIDFISYVDLEDGMVHTIVTNEDADVMPPIDGDYQKVNDVTIPYLYDMQSQYLNLHFPHF